MVRQGETPSTPRILFGFAVCTGIGRTPAQRSTWRSVSSSPGWALRSVVGASSFATATDATGLPPRSLSRSGDRAMEEDPGYPAIAAELTQSRLRDVPLRVDADGLYARQILAGPHARRARRSAGRGPAPGAACGSRWRCGRGSDRGGREGKRALRTRSVGQGVLDKRGKYRRRIMHQPMTRVRKHGKTRIWDHAGESLPARNGYRGIPAAPDQAAGCTQAG
jgi:hypothetical protein